MKLKYIIPSLVAALGFLGSCSEGEDIVTLGEVQLTSSYVAIPEDGGTTSITVKSQGAWAIDTTGTKSWLTVSPVSGNAGETTVSFSAPASSDAHQATLAMECMGKTQYINVLQGLPTVTNASVAEVLAGPDSKTYRVTGTVTKIANTTYGNWYLDDGTSDTQLYIYGTLDAKGNEKNFSSLGLEIGDEVTVEGPKKTYGSTVELVNVTVVKINKSLIKVESATNDTLDVEGGEATYELTCKGNGVTVDIPEDAKEWLSIASIESNMPTAKVVFKAAPNTGGDRSTTITFRTTDGEKNYSAQATLLQKGAIVKATIAEFLAAEVGQTQYRVQGVITKVANEKYGNVYIKDGNSEVYVYGITNFADKGLAEGDVVTLVSPRAEYKGTPQMSNAVCEDVMKVEKVTVAEFLAKEESNDKYYQITGNVSNIANTTYGNFDIEDATGKVYIYGLLTGINGKNKQFESLGVNEGDNITIITVRTSYNGTAQGKNAWYISTNVAE